MLLVRKVTIIILTLITVHVEKVSQFEISAMNTMCAYYFTTSSENCLDRHVQNNPERTALIWEKNRREGEREGTHEHISYRYSAAVGE